MHAKDSILGGLNERQTEAVLATDGPVLILAGPGSGKTRTLTARIAHLIQKGVLPERIIALTFTNKAAEEMRARIKSLLGAEHIPYGALFVGTFHALCVRVLRQHAVALGYSPHFSIFDDDDALGLIKEGMKGEGINTKQFPPGMIRNVISGLKNELISPERYADEAGSDMFPKTVHRVYRAYAERLKESNGMDFDDLLMNVAVLFERTQNVLSAYQERFLYIHVDEYQDTNHAQYTIVRALAQKHRNIAVVGDDAQAIYGFRGADFRNILNFEKDWPDAKIVVLDENYRSTQTILDAAREVISKNTFKKEKKLWTKQGKGERLTLTAAEDERGEAEYVADSVRSLHKEGAKLREVAVLYRTNAQSRAIEEAFLERDLPYIIIGGIRFYERKEIKDIIAYLRVLINPRDLVSLKRIINTPPRGIGKISFLSYLSRDTKGDMRHTKKEAALAAFEDLISDLRSTLVRMQPSDFIKYLVKKTRYREYLDDGTQNADERWENVEEFVSLAARYNDLSPEEGIKKLLEDAALLMENDPGEAAEERVTLMTVHAAKGLEFSTVFIVGLEEGVFPHSKSLFSPKDLEEERRLCYVGLTRAKKRVYLSFALRRMRFGGIEVNPPSRFLSEIPEELLHVPERDLDEITID